MATATKKPAAKPAAKKAAPKKPAAKTAPAVPELTPIDDGVSVTVSDAHADIKINGRFDRDGLVAVAKRVERARAELS